LINTSLIFPGQGSQFVGMGRDLFDNYSIAKEMFEELNDTLGYSLSKIMFEGPIETLTLTEHTQPSLMAMSAIIVKIIEMESGVSLDRYINFAAGHSLGEYSALTVANAINFVDAAKILKSRGQAMQSAVPIGKGSMVAILGADIASVEEIAAEASKIGICSVANDNSVGQIVLSGSSEAIEKAIEISKNFGIKKCIRLPVSAPFHCKLMVPAAETMGEKLKCLDIKKPKIKIISNVTAKPVSSPQKIRDLLLDQITATVRWRESVLFMINNGTRRFIEIGAGKVLTGLTRRIDKNINCKSVETPHDIEDILTSLIKDKEVL